jgi:hypothetical protein
MCAGKGARAQSSPSPFTAPAPGRAVHLGILSHRLGARPALLRLPYARPSRHALVQVSLHGVPATAVLTTNIARFTTDIGTILLDQGRGESDAAKRRASQIWPAILGFVVGCSIGAICEARYGLTAVALPTVLALIAFAIAWAAPCQHMSNR